jgi:peptide/nickel transport system ATP-binding protein
MATLGEPILRVENLVKHFPITQGILFKKKIGAVQAVDGVSFELHRGETLGIVGESGCGKSTLAKLLMRLEQPSAGRAILNDRDIFKLSGSDLRKLRRNVQMVMQDPYTSLNPRMTVGDIIGEPMYVHGILPKDKIHDRVAELLSLVGLHGYMADRYPHQLSGGQRQRVGIARALSVNPKFIVCDEAVSALDVSIQGQVINLLEELQQKLGLSYLFIAHDLAVVRHISDYVSVMYLGKVVETGTADEVYEQSGHPYTQALLSAVPEADPRRERERRRIVLEGDLPSPVDPPSGCRFRTRCWKAQEVCATQEPLTVLRAADPHPSACHFAEVRPGA